MSPDLVTLSWLLGEVREALARVERLLETQLQDDPEDRSSLRAARAALHQANGALEVAGITGVSLITREAQALIDSLDASGLPLTGDLVSRLGRAFTALVEHLEELMRETPHQPLYLYPYYSELLQARGAERIHPADLFFPDLSVKPPAPEHAARQAGSADLAAARAAFERGLLRTLRGPASGDGPRAMAGAMDEVSGSSLGAANRLFWWVTQAYFDALCDGQLTVDVDAKRLLARLNLQLRKTVDEHAPVADRLLRDMLFALARVEGSSARVQAVRAAFALSGAVPADFALPRYGRLDGRMLRVARDALGKARVALDKVSRGSHADIAEFTQAIDVFRDAADRLPSEGLRALASALAVVRRVVRDSDTRLRDDTSLEIASAILFAEQALEAGARPGSEYDLHGGEMAERLRAALEGSGVEDEDLPEWLRRLSQAAQERMTMAAFIGEAMTTLGTVEKTLDGFFRDPAQREGLPDCVRSLRQVAGALRLLGHDDACTGADVVADRVAAFADAAEPPAQQDCELVASSAAAIGFFIEGLQHPARGGGAYELDADTGEFRAFMGRPAVAASPQPDARGMTNTPVAGDAPESVSVETQFERQASQAAQLFTALCAADADPVLRRQLRQVLEHLRDSAVLLDAGSRRAAATQAIGQLAAGVLLDTAALSNSLAAAGVPIAVQVPAAPELPQDADAQSSELMDIFMTEAEEVLASIAQHAVLSSQAPSDGEHLATLRRGFHTLKGSGRMVGLADFGEAGWAMEQVMNLWLSDERPGTEALYSLIDRAHALMSAWLVAMRAGASGAVDASSLVSAAARMCEGRVPDDARLLALDDPGDDGFVEMGTEPEPEPEPAVLELAPLEPETAEPQALDQEPSADVLTIGGFEISRPLYMIFLAEADELIQVLVDDIGQWLAAPERGASEHAIRAAHSLSGSARVVCLHPVHEAAARLESFMNAQHAVGDAPEVAELQLLAHAVERMQAMLHRFAAGTMPAAEPVLMDALRTLDDRWTARAPSTAHPEYDWQELDDASSDEIVIDAPDDEVSDEFVIDQPDDEESDEFVIDAPDDEAADVDTLVFEPQTVAGLPLPAPVDELDPDLLPVFVEEALDYLPQIGGNLRRWQTDPSDPEVPHMLMRQLHTVKGGARMAGAMTLGQRVHDIETSVESMAGMERVPQSRIEALIAAHDQVVAMLDAIRGVPADAAAALPMQEAFAEPFAEPFAATEAVDVTVSLDTGPQDDERVGDDAGAPGEAAADGPPALASVPALASTPAPTLVRVRADLLDKLVNEAGEVSIARSRLDNEMTGLRQSLTDLTENVSRLRTQLREIEIQADTQIQARIAQQRDTERAFDPLEFDRYTRFQELARMLAESVNDVATVHQNAMRGLEEATQDLHRQGQVLRDLQQNLMRVRMVQFGSIADRLFRVVRQSARELGKRVNLDIRGASVEVDRGVLEKMSAPIEHLLRNAVSHGIESTVQRAAAGKPEMGELMVELRQEGREIVLSLADDGGGLDYERIRARAVATGLIDEAASPSEQTLADLIFMPGFTTATAVTELSGRGVGMDVVRGEVAGLGGRIETDSVAGRGTRFTINLPLTLAVSQVVLVTAGKVRMAVPSSSVEQVLQLKPQALAAAYAERHVEWHGTKIALFYLGTLIDLPDPTPVAQHLSPVVILRSGHQRIALHCDDITRNQEVVVKPVGGQAARVRGVTGATVLGNGDILLIVNPVVLAQVAAGDAFDRVLAAPNIIAVLPDALPAIAMVVDDSLTVRKVTQRLLARDGYQVLLAKDGVDALRQLDDIMPAVMLVDIEMPRMDGFDLTRTLRADDRYKDIPIIMITSRTADKHRNHALSLGVDAFLGKPYAEDELLSLVASFVARGRPAANDV